MNRISLISPAKINLTLDILGFDSVQKQHQILSIMQEISVHDTIVIEKIPEPKIIIRCSKKDVPQGAKNICYKAVKLFEKHTGKRCNVRITIRKKIPICAGFGGASSNAVSVIRGLAQLFQEKFSIKKLEQIAGELGSDTVFFVHGGTCLATHFGEKITPLPSLKNTTFKISTPRKIAKKSTKKAYAQLHKKIEACGKQKEKTHQLRALIESQKSLSKESLAQYIHNDFAIIYGKKNGHLSGSGPGRFTFQNVSVPVKRGSK